MFKRELRELQDHNEIIVTLEAVERGELEDKLIKNGPVRARGGDIFLYRRRSKDDSEYLNDEYTGGLEF